MFYLEITSFRILWSRLGSVCFDMICYLALPFEAAGFFLCSCFQLLIDTVPGCFFRLLMLHVSFEMVVAFRSSGPRPEQRRCTLGGRLEV